MYEYIDRCDFTLYFGIWGTNNRKTLGKIHLTKRKGKSKEIVINWELHMIQYVTEVSRVKLISTYG